jgi:UDP:flavonoid glycosyltransferase YjiC (YdhE family)
MAAFLLTTLPTNDLGLLTRSLPIASELAARGHSIVFCSPAASPRRLIAEAGFRNVTPRHPVYQLAAIGRGIGPLTSFIRSRGWREDHGSLRRFVARLLPALPLKYAPATSEVWDTDHAAAMMGMLNQGFVRAMCQALIETIDECRPDVIVDFWNPCAVIAARVLHKPLVTVIQADAHPASRGFIWWKPRPAGTPTAVGAVNAVMRSYGLDGVNTLREMSIGDLTLVVGTPETDPLPDGVAVSYIGASLWQSGSGALPEAIAALGSDRPLVWIYSGNPRYGFAGEAFDSLALLKASIEALAGEDVRVVLTTGYHEMPKRLLPLPPNVQHEPYVPGLTMAARSDLLVHHGGYGSCQTGLYCGNPAVIVPTFSERESNARRVAAVGAGIVVPVDTSSGKKRVDAAHVRAAVRRLLAEPSFTANAALAGERLRAYGGAVRAASLIEKFCP